MSEKIFQVWNGPFPTAAGQASVSTGTVIKTMLQVATPATMGMTIIEWGISFNGSAAATPILCELLTTGTVGATVTAYVNADITRVNQQGQASLMTLGAAASGYTASAEGTITATDTFDAQFVAPTGQYVKQWPLGREPDADLSTFLRIRVTAPAAVQCLCYVTWAE